MATFNFSSTASKMLSSSEVSQLSLRNPDKGTDGRAFFLLLELFLLNVLRKHLKVLTLAWSWNKRHFNRLALHLPLGGEHAL